MLGVTPHYGQEQTHPDSQAPSIDCALISAAWGPRGIEDGGVTPITMLGVSGATKENSALGCQVEAARCLSEST